MRPLIPNLLALIAGRLKAGQRASPNPVLSIVLVVYRMPEQAARTLHTLSPRYQRGVREQDYEVIVVENESDQPLGAAKATSHAGNVRYFARRETRASPVFAINFGASQARGSHIAVMIDGARMLTPGVVRLSLEAVRIASHAAVAVPGYHLGRKLQQLAVEEGYDEHGDTALLASIGWPADGYRLHEIATLSGSCRSGFFRPIAESNFLVCSRDKWSALRGMDERYDDHGGGYANLDLYKRLLDLPETPLYLLFGEGTFHQFHGGVTTGHGGESFTRIFAAIQRQDAAIHGLDRVLPANEPILFGSAHPPVYRFIRHSIEAADVGLETTAPPV